MSERPGASNPHEQWNGGADPADAAAAPPSARPDPPATRPAPLTQAVPSTQPPPPTQPAPPTQWYPGQISVPPEPGVPTSPVMQYGAPQQVPPGMALPGPTGPSGSSLGPVLAVVGGVVIVALIGVIGYLTLSGGDEVADPKPAATTAPAPTEAPVATEEPVTSEAPTNTEAPSNTEAPTATDEPTKSEPADNSATTDAPEPAGEGELTDVQRQAAAAAREHLDTYSKSRLGLIEYLVEYSDQQFSEEDATIAVDYLDIDWDDQARRRAELSIEVNPHSKPGLIRYLSGDVIAFTEEQAIQAVDGLDVDWSIQPERYARNFANSIPVSRERLLSIMKDEPFEEAEAEAGIDAADIDFNAEAAEAAEQHLEDGASLTCEELTEYLAEFDDFTPEEAAYGAGTTSVC